MVKVLKGLAFSSEEIHSGFCYIWQTSRNTLKDTNQEKGIHRGIQSLSLYRFILCGSVVSTGSGLLPQIVSLVALDRPSGRAQIQDPQKGRILTGNYIKRVSHVLPRRKASDYQTRRSSSRPKLEDQGGGQSNQPRPVRDTSRGTSTSRAKATKQSKL
jgi:hypothetical protein